MSGVHPYWTGTGTGAPYTWYGTSSATGELGEGNGLSKPSEGNGLSKLSEFLQSLHEKVESIRVDVDSLRGDLATLRGKCVDYDDDRGSLQRRVDQLEAENIALKERLNAADSIHGRRLLAIEKELAARFPRPGPAKPRFEMISDDMPKESPDGQ